MKVLSAEQIRQWDEYTILNEPVTSIDLMERAAESCTRWLSARFANKRIKIFCGKGNNGADGLAIARQLAAKNILADVYIVELGALGSPDFQTNLSRLHTFPVPIHFIQHPDFFPALDKSDVVVDALYGTGLNRPLEGLTRQLVLHINQSATTVVAVDIPSGLFCDRPTSDEAVIKAGHTLTFQLLKLCFLFPENEVFFGDVQVMDIGLHTGYLQQVTSHVELVDLPLIQQIYKPRKKFSHKGTFGHSLVIAGEKGKMGAAVLCATACLRAGAGLVTAIVPEDQFPVIQAGLPEAMAMSHDEIATIDWLKYASIGIGPGLGTQQQGAELLHTVLSHYNKPVVVDADGLNIISQNQELLVELPPGSILSPHPKEFERLFGKAANHPERIQTARVHAQKLFVYIIVKGHNSFVACPDGEVYFNTTGNAGMATGGSGDVLTGILTGLLAQGYLSKEACLLGMYLHGLAADIAVQDLSQEALIAGDLTRYLGKAFMALSS